jgi:hypothetical protein
MPQKPILERAFEMAQSGDFSRVKDLEKALSSEGYARGDPHIHSPSVRLQLRRICQTARSRLVA